MGRHGIAAYAAFAVFASGVLGQEKPSDTRPVPDSPREFQEESPETPGKKPSKKLLPVKEPKPPPGQMEIQFGEVIQQEAEGMSISLLTGLVRFRKDDLDLTAARAMIWRRGDAEPHEIYAEGNVIVRQGTNKFRAERVFFDVDADRGYIIDMRAGGVSEKMKNSFFILASEARMITRGLIKAKDVKVTTCDYGLPHYHMDFSEATLIGIDPREPKGPEDKWNYDYWEVRAENVEGEFVQGVPFFFFPLLVFGPWIRDVPLKSLQYGHSRRFGDFVLSDWQWRIRKFDERKGKRKTWGRVDIQADWRRERGGAGGVDLKYEWDAYSGFIDTYFLHDLGRNLKVPFETKFPPLEHDRRGRIHAFHRQDLDDRWRFELEGSYLSDRSLLEEFFEQEFKEEKEPETAGYVRWRDGNKGAYLLERHRINPFQTQNEYLPRLDYYVLHEPFLARQGLDNVYLTHRTDVVHIRRLFDEETHIESERMWREDFTNELSVPVDCRWFQISGFGQNRLTVYGSDLEGDSVARSLWTAGGRANTQIYATHPGITWDSIGLRGVRHIMELEGRFADTMSNNIAPSDLFQFEETEALDVFEEAAFQMRHRFMTKDEDGKSFEFLSAGAMVEYYPNYDRDSIGPNVNNYQAPFNWFPLGPSYGPGGFTPRRWSNIYYDATLSPKDYFNISVSGEYNTITSLEDARGMVLNLFPISGFNARVGHTFVRAVTDAYSLSLSWAVTEKWSATVNTQYDYLARQFISKNMSLARDFHDYLLQAVVEEDFGRDERLYYIALTPKFLKTTAKTHFYGRR